MRRDAAVYDDTLTAGGGGQLQFRAESENDYRAISRTANSPHGRTEGAGNHGEG